MANQTDIVLTVSIGGVSVGLSPLTIKLFGFVGSEIVSGEKYYIDKAVELGAKPKPKRKAKPKASE